MEDKMQTVARLVRANIPVVIWGPPGVGKTARVMALAEEAGLPIEVVIASTREPSDFLGLPVLAAGGGVTYAPPAWAIRLANAGRGVLYLDEISCTPPAVQAALLRVVLERVVGELVLPQEVRVVAAANPPDQAAGGWELALPLANRFAHLTLSRPSPAEWAAGLERGWAPTPVGVTISDPIPDWAMSRARRLVAEYIRRRGWGDADGQPAPGEWAYPTPRSWEMAAKALAAVIADGLAASQAAAEVAACVGQAAATQFISWVKDYDLPDPIWVLSHPAEADIPRRGDILHSLLEVLVETAIADLAQWWDAAWTYLIRVARAGYPDISLPAASRLAQAGIVAGLPDPPGLDAWAGVLAEEDA